MEAKTCPETTELKTRCVQILIKGRSLPKQQPGEISNSTLEVAPSSVKLQKKEKGKKRRLESPNQLLRTHCTRFQNGAVTEPKQVTVKPQKDKEAP